MLYLLFALSLVAPLWAQPVPQDPLFLQDVRVYLDLTEEQFGKILAANEEFDRWANDRYTRFYVIQREIEEETAREQLDATAIGARYVEIETIRREYREREKALVNANVALLNATQLARLSSLTDALKLVYTAYYAQNLKLLPTRAFPPSPGFVAEREGFEPHRAHARLLRFIPTRSF